MWDLNCALLDNFALCEMSTLDAEDTSYPGSNILVIHKLKSHLSEVV